MIFMVGCLLSHPADICKALSGTKNCEPRSAGKLATVQLGVAADNSRKGCHSSSTLAL